MCASARPSTKPPTSSPEDFHHGYRQAYPRFRSRRRPGQCCEYQSSRLRRRCGRVGAGALSRAARRAGRRCGTGSRRSGRSQSLFAYRWRWHRDRDRQASGNGPGYLHGPGYPGRGRTGCGLGAGAGGRGARRCPALCQSGDGHAGNRRQHRDRQLLPADAHRGCHRQGDAGRRRSPRMGSPGCGDLGEPRGLDPCGVRKPQPGCRHRTGWI